MYGSNDRLAATAELNLEQRKEILETYFIEQGYSPKHLTESGKDELVKHLRELGYHAPMFDMAFRVLLSEQRSKSK